MLSQKYAKRIRAEGTAQKSQALNSIPRYHQREEKDLMWTLSM
jgi:hypothetical protein